VGTLEFVARSQTVIWSCSILRWIVPDNWTNCPSSWTIFYYSYECKRDNEKKKDECSDIDPCKASYEIDIRYLIHSIVVIVLGAGAFSVDSIIGLR
jgi:hypothetical protein